MINETNRMSLQELNSKLKQRRPVMKRNKYCAIKTFVDGERFDSKKEAEYFLELRLLQKAGSVVSIDRQQKFSLDVNGIHICNYIADFVITFIDGKKEVHDVKGYTKRSYVKEGKKRTQVSPAYREFALKQKLMLAVHGITVIVV